MLWKPQTKDTPKKPPAMQADTAVSYSSLLLVTFHEKISILAMKIPY